MINKRPYKVMAAYDSETTNIYNFDEVVAFPVLHQLGQITPDYSLIDINSENVECIVNVELFRDENKLYNAFEKLILTGKKYNVVPVVMVHNLSFDMYSLASFLLSYNTKVLAKSNTKPITFTLCDNENNPILVFWDTLIFYQKSLASMGKECGYLKALGSWDYSKVRAPSTPLTDDEIYYSKTDIYLLFVYLSYYLKLNPLVEPDFLGLNVVTKTGVVRAKRKKLFDQVKSKNLKYNAGRFWNYLNKTQLPKSEHELYTMHACTRGGFTFCSGVFASKPLDLVGSNYRIVGYDATSQHPAMMVSHLYPVNFRKASKKNLYLDLKIISNIGLFQVLNNWLKPFPIAFNMCIKFKNLRLKNNTIYKKFNIAPIAIARINRVKVSIYDNQQSAEFYNYIEKMGFKDTAINPVYSFGKLTSADECNLFLTELAYWEVYQAYEWDNIEPVFGYDTTNFIKPSDYSLLSVLYFYKAKRLFKIAREQFYNNEPITNIETLYDYVPHYIVDDMVNGNANSSEIESIYLGLKSDLNALFGCEATNETRGDTILTKNGIETISGMSLENLPKNPKSWYQFGQRIVGWSRIAQHIVMQLCRPYIKGIINGDTDSIKFYCSVKNIPKIDKALSIYNHSLDKAKGYVLSRIKNNYIKYYDSLDSIGYYIKEFEADRFAASWNKAYCEQLINKRTGERKFKFTLAGIPTTARSQDENGEINNSLNDLADYLYSNGWTFSQVTSLLLGYNLTIDTSITKLNGRKIPKFGGFIHAFIIDYLGNKCVIDAPSVMALYPLTKSIGNTDILENKFNSIIAKSNNPDVNTNNVLIRWIQDKPEIIEL